MRIFLSILWPVIGMLALVGELSAEDPNALFQSCAYTPAPPSRLASTGSGVRNRLWSAGDRGAAPGAALPWDHAFRTGERFRIEATAPFDGYFYVLQDDPKNPALVFPQASEQDNRLIAGKARRFPSARSSFKIASAQPVHLMLLISRQRIAGIEVMTWDEAREYAVNRARCGILLLEDHAVMF